MSCFRDNESGGFSEEGITSEIINGTILQCLSDHLTSFAVLVDTTGTNVWLLMLSTLYVSLYSFLQLKGSAFYCILCTSPQLLTIS